MVVAERTRLFYLNKEILLISLKLQIQKTIERE